MFGLLKSKPEIGSEEFCRDFYDSNIFHAVIGGQDEYSSFLEFSFNHVVEADPSFATVDRDLFRREVTALHMELFGLAWMHRLKQERFLLFETTFTKRYLEEQDHFDIWENMLAYNIAISKSVSEILRLTTGEQKFKLKAVLRNKSMMDFFAKSVEAGADESCAARICNRMSTAEAWDSKITLKHITARCADRLKCNENLDPEALFRLSVIFYGFYNGAMEAIKSVKLKL